MEQRRFKPCKSDPKPAVNLSSGKILIFYAGESHPLLSIRDG
jgi:hypothetical protein